MEWIGSSPCRGATLDEVSVADAREVLDADHAGLEDVKERIVEYWRSKLRQVEAKGIGDWTGQGARRDPHPHRPARHRQDLNRQVDRARASPRVRAHVARRRARRGRDPRLPSTYIGALPGRPAGAERGGTMNLVIMLDEVDKVGAD